MKIVNRILIGLVFLFSVWKVMPIYGAEWVNWKTVSFVIEDAGDDMGVVETLIEMGQDRFDETVDIPYKKEWHYQGHQVFTAVIKPILNQDTGKLSLRINVKILVNGKIIYSHHVKRTTPFGLSVKLP